MNFKRLCAAAVLPAALFLAGCTSAPKTETKKAPREFLVRTAPVRLQPLRYQMETTGALEAQDVYQVDTEVAGILEGIRFKEGDEVTTKTQLATISHETYKLARDRAKAGQTKAEADLKKAEADARKAEADTADVARTTETAMALAKARLAEAERELLRVQPAFKVGAVTERDLAAAQLDFDLRKVELEDAGSAARTRVAAAQSQSAAARTAVEVSQAAKAAAQADLDVAEHNLKKSTVRPPLEGVIEQRLASNGKYSVPGTPVARIVDARRLRLRFTLPEQKAVLLENKARVSFQVLAYPNRFFSAEVYRIGDLADQKTRLVTCWANVTPPAEADGGAAPRLKAGNFATVKIVTEERQKAVVIPITASLPTEDGAVAYVVEKRTEDGAEQLRAFRRKVTLGQQLADQALEVIEGLKEGEVVVVEGANSLRNNVLVRERAAGGKPEAQGAGSKTSRGRPADTSKN